MDEGRNSSLIFVNSPPGSGKTSLITSYLDVRKIPFLWYKLDEGDGDVATFFHYMGIAAERIAAKKRKPLPAFSPEYLRESSAFSRRYFEELFSRVKTPFIFVFDNYQDVPPDSGFHDMICKGLADIPKGINVVVASRKAPPLPFASMYADNRMRLLGWDEIRFTLEETKEFVQMKKPANFSDGTVHFLYKNTDGWAAGLLLMTERLKENAGKKSLGRLSSTGIFDYFAYEIFQKLDSDIREFLLKTAFLPQMTAEMAERLTEMHRSEKILAGLSKDRYFTDVYFQENPVYRYHPLFREFLEAMAREFFGSEELSRIKRKAAALLEESGSIEDSVQLYQDCGDVESLTAIIQKWAQSLVKQGRYQTLHAWLNSLPENVLSASPWLRYWMGTSRLPFNPDESMIQFEFAFQEFRKCKDAEGTFLAWCGVVESIMYGSEGLEHLDSWIFTIDELLKEFKSFPSEYIEANVVCGLMRALSLRRFADFNAEKWVGRVQVITQKTKDIPLKIKALISLLCYLYAEGNFSNIEIVLESLRELVKGQEIPPLQKLTMDWLTAAYFNAMSRYDECQKVVSEGVQLAHDVKINLMEYLLLGHGLLSALKNDDLETARQHLQKMASALSFLKPWEASFYHYCAAWEAMYRDDIAYASTHSEHCMRLCEKIGNPWTMSLAHILKAYIASALGEPGKAMNHVTQAFSIGLQSKNEFTPFICLITKAYFNLKQRKDQPALEAIRRGLQIGREKGFANIFMGQRDVLKVVLSKALEAGIEVDYVKGLIGKNRIVPDDYSLEIEDWPWPLKLFTLGGFKVIIHEKPVCCSGKVQHKPLLMLKALVAFGGKDVAEGFLADILWPEADGDAAHSAFATTLSRLRHLLGIEAVRFQEGKASLDPAHCWVDVWAFERFLEKADGAWGEAAGRKDGDRLAELTGKALKLYTGPFLLGENEPWIISTRERVRNKFLRNVKKLGRYYEEAGDLEKAVECYQKGLEVDDLAEEFYQLTMRCCLRMGRRAEAMAAFKRCSAVLSAVLGVEPSPETMALAKSLKR